MVSPKKTGVLPVALEYHQRGPSSPYTFDVVLTACPFCDHDFKPHESRPEHIGEHTPSDAGLTPLGEGGDASGPLFESDPAVATDGGEARER